MVWETRGKSSHAVAKNGQTMGAAGLVVWEYGFNVEQQPLLNVQYIFKIEISIVNIVNLSSFHQENYIAIV